MLLPIVSNLEIQNFSLKFLIVSDLWPPKVQESKFSAATTCPNPIFELLLWFSIWHQVNKTLYFYWDQWIDAKYVKIFHLMIYRKILTPSENGIFLYAQTERPTLWACQYFSLQYYPLNCFYFHKTNSFLHIKTNFHRFLTKFKKLTGPEILYDPKSAKFT